MLKKPVDLHFELNEDLHILMNVHLIKRLSELLEDSVHKVIKTELIYRQGDMLYFGLHGHIEMQIKEDLNEE